MATRAFPLRFIPLCGVKDCGQPCSRALVQNAQHSGRPYYFCQRGHPRYFATWDDSFGIESGNPECRCRFLSRRERQRGPILKEWFSCATKECSFREDILPADEYDAQKAQTRTYNNHYTWGSQSQTVMPESQSPVPTPAPAPAATWTPPVQDVSPPTAIRHETATDMAALQQGFSTLNVGVNVTQRHETPTRRDYRRYICNDCDNHDRRSTLSKIFRGRRCYCY